ncbi:MAG: hypothetical protein ACRC2T_03185, partial [Thermoguttaceae bacterium]
GTTGAKEALLIKFCKEKLDPAHWITTGKTAEAVLKKKLPPREALENLINSKKAVTVKDIDILGLSASEKAAAVNELSKAGKIWFEFGSTFKTYTIHLMRHSVTGTRTATQPVSAGLKEQFRAAYDRQQKGGYFARICDMRRDLNWPKEQFDAVLKELRDAWVIQLHPGDMYGMTPQDVDESFTAENNALYLNISWR